MTEVIPSRKKESNFVVSLLHIKGQDMKLFSSKAYEFFFMSYLSLFFWQGFSVSDWKIILGLRKKRKHNLYKILTSYFYPFFWNYGMN